VRIDTRWATANVAEIRRHAAELVALAPDIILAHGDTAVVALLSATRTVPIVFPVASDPVAAGFVESLAKPSGIRVGSEQKIRSRQVKIGAGQYERRDDLPRAHQHVRR
jgi:ABC-type uncharacterized transport system substrate-binding protein